MLGDISPEDGNSVSETNTNDATESNTMSSTDVDASFPDDTNNTESSPNSTSDSAPNSHPDSEESSAPAEDATDDSTAVDNKDADTTDKSGDGFSATLAAESLQTLFDIPASLLDEVRFQISADEVTLTCPDPANVALAEVTLSRDAFDQLIADDAEFGINLDQATEISGFYERNSSLSLEITDSGKLTYDDGVMEFSQGLINSDAMRATPPVPDIDDSTTFSVDTAFLSRAVDATDMVADHIQFTATDGDVVATADGDTDAVEVASRDDELHAPPADEFSVMLDLDYLTDIVSGIPADNVSVEAGTKVPIVVRGDFADGAGEFVFMLAPRIKSD